MNSIINNLSIFTTISRLKLLNPKSFNNNIFLIVENEKQVNFFKNFVSDNVKLIPCYCKSGIDGFFDALPFINNNIFGIGSKNYKKMNNKKNVFTFDYCCFETMLIDSNLAFENTIRDVYYGNAKLSILKQQFLESLYPLSKLREANYDNSYDLNFNNLNFCNLIEDNGDISCEKVVNSLEKNKEVIENIFYNEKINIKNSHINLMMILNITNGKDFVDYFYNYCLRHNRYIKINDFYNKMTIFYSFEDFKKTNLYVEVNQYILNNHFKFWGKKFIINQKTTNYKIKRRKLPIIKTDYYNYVCILKAIDEHFAVSPELLGVSKEKYISYYNLLMKGNFITRLSIGYKPESFNICDYELFSNFKQMNPSKFERKADQLVFHVIDTVVLYSLENHSRLLK